MWGYYNTKLVVSNSSPIIALTQISELELLKNLFSIILVPPAVVSEVSPTVTLPNWIIERGLMQNINSQVLNAFLGPGESETISLALETRSIAIIDERPARRLATSLRIPVIGTLGILLKCKQEGFIANVQTYIDDLINNYDFRVSNNLYTSILTNAGELS